MILENRIPSIDTQDVNLETYNIVRYLRICKDNDYYFQLKIDFILKAIVKYSEKYPELPDHEKNELVKTLTQLDLSLANQKKVQKILKNFGLPTKN